MDYQIAHSIQELDEAEWNAVAGDDLTMSYRMHRVQEAGRPGYRPCYVLFKDSRGPQAIVTLNLADYFGRAGLIERLLSRFTLTVRAPYSMYHCGVTVRPDVPLEAVLPRLDRVLQSLCWKKQRVLVGVSNVNSLELPHWKSQGFMAVPQVPDSIIELPETYEQYLKGLRSKGRREINRMGRKVEAAAIRFDFRPLNGQAETVHSMISAVYEKNKGALQPELHSLPFLRALERELPDNHLVFSAYVQDELAGVIVLLHQKPRMWWPVVGFNYELSRLHNLYFVMIDEGIRWGMANGMRWINTGITCLREKQSRGFQARERWFCCRAYPGALNAGLKLAMALARRRRKAVSKEAPADETAEADGAPADSETS